MSENRRRMWPLWMMLVLSMAPRNSVSEPSNPHVVVRYDTLWHISERYLHNPVLWPQLWSYNPHIVNPHLIYPGDLVYFAPTTPSPAAASAGGSADDTPTPEPVVRRSQDETAVATVPTDLPDSADEAQWQSLSESAESIDLSDIQSDNGVASATATSAPAYVDKLIDPEVAEDTFADYQPTRSSRGVLQGIEHSVEVISHYRDDNVYFDSSIDYGLLYTARLQTRNWGDLRLNVVALDEFNDYQGVTGDNNGFYQPQSGVERVSLEQYNLPLTESLSMDNVIGTHRQLRYNPLRGRANLINYRFSAAEPDIRGISSRLKFGHTAIGVSMGELGQTRGSILPGFEETEGNVKRLQVNHVLERHALSAEVWRTDDQTQVENRSGYRLGYDWIFGENTLLSFSSVGSGDQFATLIGGSTENDFSKHDYGAYHFDPDLLWIDTRIGDDNAGVFYRYHNRRGTMTWGSSVEVRRDRLSQQRSEQTDTAFLSFNMTNRLNRRSSVSSAYNYRRTDRHDHLDRSIDEHSVRGYLSTNHRGDARSNVGVLVRSRTEESEVDLNWGYVKGLPDDSSVELETTARNTFDSDRRGHELNVIGRWSKQFMNGSFLSMGLGYTFGSSDYDDNSGINGYLNLESPITDRLTLSLQLNYSRDRAEYEEDDLDTLFFTDTILDDEDFREQREFSALLSIKYRFGGSSPSSIMASRGRANGAGDVRGVVFVDSNNDGIRQAGEPGVEGITLFLNSVYPLVTNERGEYSYPSVGSGQHFIFVDESSLPLPWALSNGEYQSLSVRLRQTSQLDIPIRPIELTDAPHQSGRE